MNKHTTSQASSTIRAPSLTDIPLSQLVLAFIVFLIAIRGIAYFLSAFFSTAENGASVSFPLILLVFIQNLLILIIIRYFLLKKYNLNWQNLGLVPTTTSWYYRAALLTLPLVVIVGIVNSTVTQLISTDFVNPQLEMLAPQGFKWDAYILTMIATGIIAPFAEEIVFRGVILGWLDKKLGKYLAILISSFLFGSTHGIPALIPALTVAGIAFSVIVYKSQSLWPAIILHSGFNMFMTTALYYALSQGVSLPGAN
ncbi:CPBP family intramembrane glutamic endopeptidase [Kiloniella sp. EL199]|uniref:CPBP family intramembrane glutamic endopeptidase n=1 Tax=Kiloniella sp. EL199 TaxID=2107581 RepID=UPI000EA063A1|nr:type II CAAX endopeptidase family protein [Kiloniella sp. EL199]